VLNTESLMHRALPIIVLLTTACAISEEDFIEQYASQVCDNIEACGKISVEHGTKDKCILHYEIVADEQMIGDGCEIISDKAKDCIGELEDFTEEDCPFTTNNFAPSCAEVGDCPGGSSGGDTGL